MKRTIVLVFALSGLASGLAIAADPVSPIKAQMKAVVEPASNILFAVGGEVDPENGPDAAKVPDARWKEGAAAARALNGFAARLNDKALARPGPEWAGFVAQLSAVTAKAGKAAAAKNGAALSAAANELSDTCSACHAKFLPQS